MTPGAADRYGFVVFLANSDRHYMLTYKLVEHNSEGRNKDGCKKRVLITSPRRPGGPITMAAVIPCYSSCRLIAPFTSSGFEIGPLFFINRTGRRPAVSIAGPEITKENGERVSSLQLLLGFGFLVGLVGEQSKGGVVFEDVAHVLDRLPSDAFRCSHLDVPKPDVGVEV